MKDGKCVQCDPGTYSSAGATSCTTCTGLPSNAEWTGSATSNACPWRCKANYYKSGSLCAACSDVSFTDTGTETQTITGGSRTRSKTRTCYRTTSSAGSTSSSACSGSGNCGAWSYGAWDATCSTGYTQNANDDGCNCNTNCTAVLNKSSTQDCTRSCDIDHGTCSYSGAKQTCNGNYTAGGCSSAGATCSGCSSWGTCTGGTKSITCHAGYYLKDGECVQCESGYYCPGDNSRASCTSWRSNTNTNGATGSTGTSACVCKAGYYLSGSTCTACDKGTYKSANSNATSCTAAGAGYYVSTTGATSRSACSSYRANTDTGVATKSTDASACVCKPGYYLNGSTCTACAKGTYKSISSNTACLTADSGYYVSTTGATAQSTCTSWRANTNTNGVTGSTSTSACVCRAGYYLNGSTCTACSTGKYKSANSNATSCTAAGSGYYVSTTGATAQSACTSWRANTNTNGATGSTGTSACVCKAGYYLNGSTCTACSTGKYKSANSNATSCTAASSGYYVSTTGATSQSACTSWRANTNTNGATGSTSTSACVCKAGYYLNGSACTACAAGKYKSANSNATSCSNVNANCYTTGTGSTTACPSSCPSNSSSPAGSDSQDDCSCNAGYGGDARTSSCTICSPGYYKSSAGNTSCSMCSAGNYCTGGTHIADCPAGTYGTSNYETSSECTGKCEAGTYSTGGQVACTVCTNKPANSSYTSATGNTSSSCPWSCNTGFQKNSAGTACEAKTYSCAAGQYLSGTSCVECPCGYKCPGGTWTYNGGTQGRTQCSGGTYSAKGAASCTGVSTGYYAAAGACSQTACTNKPTNSAYSGGASSNACPWTCSAGYFGSSANGDTSCSNCGKGYYCTGGATRVSCPAGTYGSTVNLKTAACTDKCAAGTYSTGGATSCTNCSNKPTNSSYTSATGNTSASCPWSCNTGYSKNSAGTACVGISYTVKYNANGGSGTTASSSHTYGTAKALTSNGFTNGVKKFLGWSTSSTATSATYTNGQSVSNLTSTSGGTVTLYAVWGACTACAPGTGATCTLSAPNGVCTYATSCKTGYGTMLNSGMHNPICSAKCNAITLNANGGTAGSVATLYKKTDATGYFTDNKCIQEYATTTNVKPTRSGYSFRGFYISTPADVSATESNGVARYINHTGAATDTGNSWTVNAASTLYAGWAKNCAAGTQATCTLVLGQNTSYTTGCNTGYNIKSGSGAYNPVCQANTYTVKYNINCPSGATCSSAPSSTSCSYGTTCTFSSISSTALYAGGYKLIGWGSSATGAGTTSGLNLTSTNGGTVTRYAIWSECVAGTYHPAAIGTAANVCTSASKGYYVSSDGATAQTACAKGKYSDQTGATSCKSVDMGCYADTTGSTSSCPKGVDAGCYADTTGSTTSCPKTCGSGTYSTGGASLCTVCENKPANSSYTNATGNTSASCPWSCSAGYYGSSANGNTSCANCGTGKYCTGGTNRANCPAGTYGSTANLKTDACSGKCAVGKYSTGGAASCSDVNPGCYADATGSTKACPKSCPSGYPNSAAGSDAITDCYSDSKSRAWTGGQGECLLPVGCSDVTCDTCSKPACAYVAYSNDAGTGDGIIKSGCSSNNENCLQPVKSVKALNGNYVSGLTCPSCSSLGDGSFTESAANNTGGSEVCFKSCSRACTQQSMPTGVYSVSHGGTSTTGTHYYGGSCSAAASTCSLTINTCKSGYYMNGSGATASCELCSSLANGFYPNSVNANANGASACYTNDLTGKYVKEKYASTATECACGSYKGKHTVAYGDTSSCTETMLGYYAAKGASSQTKTDAGYYAPIGACEQTPIVAGCYGGAGSGAACPNKCPEGRYRSATGGKTIDDCAICPPGFENSAAGSTSDTMCYQSCSSYQSGGYTYTPSDSIGYYPGGCAHTKTCITPCSATASNEVMTGTEYCRYNNDVWCVTETAEQKYTNTCSGNYTSDGCASAGDSCSGCSKWTRSATEDCLPTENSSWECVCTAGTYQSFGFLFIPSSDSNNPAGGANIPIGMCKACSAGYYCPGNLIEEPCGPGTYSQAGATECSPVSAGCFGTEAKETENCPDVCPAGTFSTGGAVSCTDCTNKPANSEYTEEFGITSNDCPWTCNPGFFGSSEKGDLVCRECESGYYCPGGPAQHPCSNELPENAQYSGVATENNCPWECKANYYKDGTTCMACNPGYTSPAGSTDRGQCTQECSVLCSGNDTDACPENADCVYDTQVSFSGIQAQGSACNAETRVCPLKTWTCKQGYYLSDGKCVECTDGYFCPQNDNERHECPAGYKGSDGNRGQNTDCYVSCSAKTITGGTTTVVNAKEHYNGSAYPACKYNVNCNAKYGASGDGTSDPACAWCEPGKYSAGGNNACEDCSIPDNATATGNGSTKDNCPWECDDGYNLTPDDKCEQFCAAGVTHIHLGTGLKIPLYSSKRTTPSINVRHNGTICYADLIEGESTGLHVKYNGKTYHAAE